MVANIVEPGDGGVFLTMSIEHAKSAGYWALYMLVAFFFLMPALRHLTGHIKRVRERARKRDSQHHVE